jgi:hypothetical protein
MSGLGRHLLFRVIGPPRAYRFVLDLTASFKGDGENTLPPAAGLGTTREPFPTLGRGSARVFSPPVVPQIIAGQPYLALDMGVDGQLFPERRTGLLWLWGSDLRRDPRKMTAFARDISLVSEEEYQSLTAPSVMSDVVADLDNPDLEYSGVYEDGWISESAFLGLTQPGPGSTVVAKGTVPLRDDPNFTTDVSLLVDGQEIVHQVLRPGPFELRASAPPGEGRRRVELRFSRHQQLEAPDGRPVAALMQLIGVEVESNVPPPDAIKDFPADVEKPGLRATGLQPDGWVADAAAFDLTQPSSPAEIVLRGTVPLVDDERFTTELRVLVDGQEVLTGSLGLGTFRLRAPVPPGGERRRVELRFSTLQQLAGSDRRRAAARLLFAGFEASSAAVPEAVPAVVPAAAPAPSPAALPPQAVRDFPDLANPSVQATGAFRDGWLADVASFQLTQPDGPASVLVRGMVPMVGNQGFTTELRVLVDGQEVARKSLGLGDFELRAPAPAGAGRRHVDLRFSSVQQLPAPDTRRVGARAQFVGFEADAASPQPR